MTNMGPVSRKNVTEKTNCKIISSTSTQILNKIEDFNNIVVMSGTATRKSLEKKESKSETKLFQKNIFKESILKLRAPFYKAHNKQANTEEKLMTKSCEILLGCIKPYKDIKVAKKTKVTQSICIGSVLKMTNITYERKATRKIRFFSFSEEDQTPCFLNKNPLSLLPTTSSSEPEVMEDEEKYEVFDETETIPNQTIKTVSSEDFITKVFPQAESGTLILTSTTQGKSQKRIF